MIIVDNALRERAREGRPVQVGMVGAGAMGRGLARQLLTAVPGLRLAAVASRRVSSAAAAYTSAGAPNPVQVATVPELDAAIERGEAAVTDDPLVLCRSTGIDVIVEITGRVEEGARVVLTAFEHGKHAVLMNAELNGTLGPILKQHADRAAVVFTDSDGDQPGVIMNLVRFVRGLGVTPMLCGNIKGMQDHYRNPSTQEQFARQWNQGVAMVTSFADGTKISFEQALVANATGMRVARRGMYGPTVAPGTQVREAPSWYPMDEVAAMGGVVDYVVGAEPAPGVFVIGRTDDPELRRHLAYYKLGPGPDYVFYTPYHLCHLEVPNTIARAVLFRDAAVTPLGPPVVDVVATAKTDLRAGQVLDGIGGYAVYGQCENSDVTLTDRLLPMGVAEGCRVVRDVRRDDVLTYDDVELPEGRLVETLRADQDAWLRRSSPSVAEAGSR